MDLLLTDRVALVTGASKGIGLAVARTLAEEGARVVAASRSLTPELAALDVLHLTADLTDPAAPSRVVAAAAEAYGGLDVVVNNAGGPVRRQPAPPRRVPHPRRRRLGRDLRVQPARRRRAAPRCPCCVERGGGAIVNVSSANARRRRPSTPSTPRRRRH